MVYSALLLGADRVTKRAENTKEGRLYAAAKPSFAPLLGIQSIGPKRYGIVEITGGRETMRRTRPPPSPHG